MDSVWVCVRVPKCGSTSLSNSLKSALAGRGIFHLPHTLKIEGDLSRLHELRFRRSQIRNVFARFLGGDIDFPSVHRNTGRDVKMIVMLRHPAEPIAAGKS